MSKKHIDAVVGELDLDATDPFTKLFAIALGMRNAHDETKAALERCQQQIHCMQDQIDSMKAEAEAKQAKIDRMDAINTSVYTLLMNVANGIPSCADEQLARSILMRIDKERGK